MNKNWARWIFASVTDHFVTNLSSVGGVDEKNIFVEGQPRNIDRDEQFYEIRVDGPVLTEVSHGCFRVDAEVNVLVQTTLDDRNYHAHHTAIGLVTQAFTDIVIYRYGNGLDDDDTVLGCFILQQDARRRQSVKVNQLGQLDPNTKLEQASIEAVYKMIIAE